MKKLTKLLLALILLIAPVVSLSGIQKVQAAETVLLDVPYFSQLHDLSYCWSGNFNEGCSITSLAMVLKYYGANATPDKVYVANGGCYMSWGSFDPKKVDPNATSIHFDSAHDNYPTDRNERAKFIKESINKGIPVIMGTDDLAYPHWMVITGYNGDNFIVNDPNRKAITQVNINYVDYIKVYTGPVKPTDPEGIAKHVTSQVFKGKLYQSYTDQDNRVRTRYTTNGSKWTELPTDGHTPGNVTMAVFTPKKGAKPRLYQFVRGLSGFVFVRYTEDGKTWKNESGGTGWEKHMIEIKNDIDTIVVKDSKGVEYMYQSVVTKDDKLAIRFKQTGMVNNWNTWKVYESARVKIDTDLTPDVINGTTIGLFVTTVKKDGDNIITQRFDLGSLPVDNMLAWSYAGATDSEINSTIYKGSQYQVVNGSTSDRIFSRKSLYASWREEIGSTKYGSSLVVYKADKKPEMLVQAVKGTSNSSFIRMTSADNFSTTVDEWQKVWEKEIIGRPDLAVYKPAAGKNLLLNTLLIKDKSGHIVPMSRYTTDGIKWSSWITPRVNEDWELQEGQTLSNITSVTFKNKLYQAVRGTVGDSIYMRSSSDGIFGDQVGIPGTIDTEKWVKQEGTTSSDINMVVYNNELYQVIGGASNSGRVFVRSTKDGVFDGEADEKWLEMTGMLANANIDFEVFGGKLYFTLVKKGTTDIYMAKQNGHINASIELNWEKQVGNTDGDVNMEVYNSKLYQIVRGTNNSGRIYIRESKDGVYNSDSEKWKELTGLDKITHVSIQNFNKKLNIVARRTDDTIYSTKITNLKVTALTWKLETGRTSKHVEMGVFGGKLFQTVRSTGDTTNIFMRSSKDGVFDLNW